MNSGRTFLFAMLGSTALLTACDESPSEQNAAATATTPGLAKPKQPGLPENMVAAVSAGRTATAVGVHFALGNTPTVNQALPVDIAIVPHRTFAKLSAHFESREGLVLTVGGDFGPAMNPGTEKPVSHQLVLLPKSEGLFMVSVVIETEGDDGSVTRVFSIPVMVAAASEPAPAPAATATSAPVAATN